MLRYFIVIMIALMSFDAFAKGDGMSVEAYLGMPGLIIENPDGTDAAFDGKSMQARLNIPIADSSVVNSLFSFSYRYHDLENTEANTGTELAKHEGYGLGFLFKMNNLILSLDYAMMNAKHYVFSTSSNQTEFKYDSFNASLGYMQQVGGAAIGLTFVIGNGKIPSSETGFTSDSKVTEQSVYLTMQYTLKSSLGDVGRGLVGK